MLKRSFPFAQAFQRMRSELELGDALRALRPAETGQSLSAACHGWLGKRLDKT